MSYTIIVANSSHHKFATAVCHLMAVAAKVRGTGIAKREPEYIQLKMSEGKAIIALNQDEAIGFCYIESWEGQKYVANSGLIVHPDYRKTGLAREIKKATFDLSKAKFPTAKLFGITTSMAVMKINSDLGYKPVTFSELTQDKAFWAGCKSCSNFDILQRTNQQMCLCTGMVCDLNNVAVKKDDPKKSWNSFKDFFRSRIKRLKKNSIQINTNIDQNDN